MSFRTFNIRLDPETARAMQAAAALDRKSASAFARDAIRARLDVGALLEPLRLAISESSAEAIKHQRLAADESARHIQEVVEDGVRELIEAGAIEREQVRALIAKFTEGLQAVLGAASIPEPTATTTSQSKRIK